MSLTRFYQTLGLEDTASMAQVKQSFKRLSMIYHPDRDTGDVDRYKDISLAYQSLVKYLNSRGSVRPSAIKQTMGTFEITLEERYTGIIKYQDIDITVPAGAKTGDLLEVGERYFKLVIKDHNQFKRSGNDLLLDVTVSAVDAMIGAVIDVVHLDGSVLQCTVPPGTQMGQVVRLQGLGLVDKKNRPGDLLVRVSIFVPKVHDPDIVELIRKMFR